MYIFEQDGHVAAPPKVYQLPNDAAALAEANKIIDGHPMRFGGQGAWSVVSIRVIKRARSEAVTPCKQADQTCAAHEHRESGERRAREPFCLSKKRRAMN